MKPPDDNPRGDFLGGPSGEASGHGLFKAPSEERDPTPKRRRKKKHKLSRKERRKRARQRARS